MARWRKVSRSERGIEMESGVEMAVIVQHVFLPP
jgi:hypothetical protein